MVKVIIFAKYGIRILVNHTEGKTDVSQHGRSAKHKHTQVAQKHSPPTVLITRNVSEAGQVTKAQLKMAMLCAKNNVAFSF